jgi:carbonic anhydrase
LLLQGNERFVEGRPASPRRRPEDFSALAEGQAPVAVIIGCADSRVAPEILFNQGVGDLFVVRVAGNVIDGAGVTVKGSIEYGVAELSVPLVMVLGLDGSRRTRVVPSGKNLFLHCLLSRLLPLCG